MTDGLAGPGSAGDWLRQAGRAWDDERRGAVEMPVKPTDSPVLKWPDADQVWGAFEAWAGRVRSRPEVEAVG